MKKLLAIILTLALCLSLAACAPDNQVPGDNDPAQHQSVRPSQNNTTKSTTKATQATQPQQDMCYWCDEVPVGDFETYCVNCRCLKCDRLRKSGGRYLYCSRHNCNESLCEYPAFDDSQYCSEHKCRKSNCDNRRWSGSEYCAHHK